MALDMFFLNPNLNRLDVLKRYGFQEADIAAWKQWLRSAEDRELYQVNPRYLAEVLRWPLERTLDALTAAIAEELWHLHWEVWCPVCGAALEADDHLGEVAAHVHCPQCQAESDVMLDQAVSVSMTVDSRLRRLRPARRDDPAFRQEVNARLGRLPALYLINRPLFRQVLGEQILPPAHSLGVDHLAVFFSDLKSSTLLYQRLGDAAAFALVREHFEVVFRAVEAHGGAAVKTMGDGVMGTFFDNAAALRGVMEAVRGLQAVNQRAGLQGDERLRLKVGLYAGPCIVVTLNHRLDYFGSTVNIAARLSALAQGDEILLGETILQQPEARDLVERSGSLTALDTSLRGVLQPVPIYRLRLAA